MRIAHVINGLDDGGAEAVLYRLCTADNENEHVVISLQDEGKYGPKLRQIGVRVETIGMRRRRLGASSLARLTRALRRSEADVVQAWMYHANLLGGLAARVAGRAPVVWGVHHTNLSPASTAVSTRAIARLGGAASRLLPKRIVYCAERTRAVHEAIVYAWARGIVIPNGYDLREFRPDPASGMAWRRAAGIREDVALVGMVGRFDPQKDHRNLLEAVAIAARSEPRFEVALVGPRMEWTNAELSAWISETGTSDRVHLLGRSDDVPAVMNGVDVHVLSSRSEAFPNVVCEAMACGTPNVVTDVGDAAAIVADTGWVVPPGDAQALAGALVASLRERAASSQASSRRCERARARVAEHYSLERMVDAYRRVWCEVHAMRAQVRPLIGRAS